MSQDIAYRFAQCEVDLLKRTVLVHAQQRRVGRKIFDLLVALIENRDRVVKRDELARIGWLGDNVSNGGPVARGRALPPGHPEQRCRRGLDPGPVGPGLPVHEAG